MSSSDYSRINEAINLLLDIKNIFRQSRPTFTLDKKHFQRIQNYLKKLNRILINLNKNFGIQYLIEANKILNFKENIKNKFFIVKSSKNRKKLIEIGFDPAQILATGGPITAMDIKILNPNISEPTLQNIRTKIQKFWKVLRSKLQQGTYNKLILLLEEENTIDKILSNNKDKFEKKLSKPIKIITISSFEHLDDRFLSSIND